ncbi:hypothetical protein HJC23_013698 [Cyclotella cryptica]|uniref:tryptophan--tRNA ligase n=1 Tax=Cyclotella cryptica TaxID=29204 RepID=A0ABD3QW73_9STRA
MPYPTTIYNPRPNFIQGGLSGKLSWNLGKKYGTEAIANILPKDDTADSQSLPEQIDQFWNKVEKAANTLIQNAEMTVKMYQYSSEEEALRALGMVIMDAGQIASREKRLKKLEKEGKDPSASTEDPVCVGHILNGDGSTYSLALLHGNNLVPLSRLGSIRILRGKNDSSVVCNKKKCEVTVKFCVIPPEEEQMDLVNGVPGPADGSGIELGKCTEKKIREEEGLSYELYMNRLAVEAMKIESVAAEAPVAADTTVTTAGAENNDDMVVTAFEVSGNIDYTKLIEKFGSKPLTPYLLKRLENLTVKRGTVDKLHRFLRREIFFSHRDIEKICELLEAWYGVTPPPEDGDFEVESNRSIESSEMPTTPCPFYLYTGRGPSSSAMHLGHLVPFLFTAWLQKAFRCPLVIQMTDDEKFLFKGVYSGENAGGGEENDVAGNNDEDPNRTGDNLNHFANLTIENAKDIIACDFIKEKTFLFSDLDYVGRMYPNIVRIWKAVTVNQVNGIFGFDSSSNIGKIAFPAVQAAPSFGSSFPAVLGGGKTNAATLACLIPCAIDQDPYFRLTRDIAHKLVPRHHPLQGKPSLIHSKFFPPLQGAQGKMSSSDTHSAIFLTDTPEDIERKIKVHAFSGGQETKKLQEELGANLEVDVSYQWLRFFLEDDEELERIGKEYGSGKGEFWSTGKVKAKLVEVLKELVMEHQERRRMVSEEVVREWMSERCIL